MYVRRDLNEISRVFGLAKPGLEIKASKEREAALSLRHCCSIATSVSKMKEDTRKVYRQYSKQNLQINVYFMRNFMCILSSKKKTKTRQNILFNRTVNVIDARFRQSSDCVHTPNSETLALKLLATKCSKSTFAVSFKNDELVELALFFIHNFRALELFDSCGDESVILNGIKTQ